MTKLAVELLLILFECRSEVALVAVVVAVVALDSSSGT
jgi:hypothetical protein